MTNQINWEVIFNELGEYNIQDFANGFGSGDSLYRQAITFGDKSRAEIRRMLRNRGVAEARQLAKKALRRRGVSV